MHEKRKNKKANKISKSSNNQNKIKTRNKKDSTPPSEQQKNPEIQRPTEIITPIYQEPTKIITPSYQEPQQEYDFKDGFIVTKTGLRVGIDFLPSPKAVRIIVYSKEAEIKGFLFREKGGMEITQ